MRPTAAAGVTASSATRATTSSPAAPARVTTSTRASGTGSVSGGGGGFDIVVGNSGIDRIDGGGGGHDIANYATASQAYNIDLGAGRASGDVRERLKGIEDAIGGTGNDTMQGSGAENRLDGGPGDDNLRAAGRGDAAFGGPGSDNCTGGFASENSCGNSGGSSRIVGVELISSIDDSTSLVIDGTDNGDTITVNRIKGGFRVIGGQTPVAPGDRNATNCNRTRSGDVECNGNAGRLVAAMKGGNDTLDASDLPKRVHATIDGGPGADNLRGVKGPNTIFSGDDNDPDEPDRRLPHGHPVRGQHREPEEGLRRRGHARPRRQRPARRRPAV